MPNDLIIVFIIIIIFSIILISFFKHDWIKTKVNFFKMINFEFEGKVKQLKKKNEEINGIEQKKLNDNPSIDGKTILWVDDHPENIEYPKQELEDRGASIELVLSTEAAMEKLEKKTYDLIISDLRRGANKTAGNDLLELRKEKQIKTPVIIHTTKGYLRKFGSKSLALGAVAVVTETPHLLKEVFKILS